MILAGWGDLGHCRRFSSTSGLHSTLARKMWNEGDEAVGTLNTIKVTLKTAVSHLCDLIEGSLPCDLLKMIT